MPDGLGWQEWVIYAEENYQAAAEILETRGLTAVLLLHQAVEKYLKAVLVKNAMLPDRSHDLVILLRLIEPNLEFENDLWKAARELTPVASSKISERRSQAKPSSAPQCF